MHSNKNETVENKNTTEMELYTNDNDIQKIVPHNSDFFIFGKFLSSVARTCLKCLHNRF